MRRKNKKDEKNKKEERVEYERIKVHIQEKCGLLIIISSQLAFTMLYLCSRNDRGVKNVGVSTMGEVLNAD